MWSRKKNFFFSLKFSKISKNGIFQHGRSKLHTTLMLMECMCWVFPLFHQQTFLMELSDPKWPRRTTPSRWHSEASTYKKKKKKKKAKNSSLHVYCAVLSLLSVHVWWVGCSEDLFCVSEHRNKNWSKMKKWMHFAGTGLPTGAW